MRISSIHNIQGKEPCQALKLLSPTRLNIIKKREGCVEKNTPFFDIEGRIRWAETPFPIFIILFLTISVNKKPLEFPTLTVGICIFNVAQCYYSMNRRFILSFGKSSICLATLLIP